MCINVSLKEANTFTNRKTIELKINKTLKTTNIIKASSLI